MAKIVTSEGIQDFVSSGKPTEVIENDQTQAARVKKASLNSKLAAVDAPVIEAPASPAPPPEEKNAAPSPSKEPTDADLDEEEKKLAKDIQKKIFKQIAKRKEAQSEAQTAREEAAAADRLAEQLFNERELWKQKAEEAERKSQATPAKETKKEPELVKPDPEDRKYYDAENKFKVWEYSADLSAFSAKQALADDRKAQAEERAKAEAEARAKAEEAAAADFKRRMDEATKKHPDWMERVGNSPLTLQNECLTYIARSVNGTELAYFLASPENKERAEKIRGLSPYEGIAALRDLEIELGLTKIAAPTAAAAPKEAEPARSIPAPITPISTSGNGSVNLDPARMSFKELRAYERERARNRR